MAEQNPHATSGTGAPRNPYLYANIGAMQQGVALDPFSAHALAPEVKEAYSAARAKVIDAWMPLINQAVAKVVAGEEVPSIVFEG
jgi:hypothetical protein